MTANVWMFEQIVRPPWYHSVVLPSLCHRAGTLIRLRDAISTVRSLLLEFWSRLDVEARLPVSGIIGIFLHNRDHISVVWVSSSVPERPQWRIWTV